MLDLIIGTKAEIVLRIVLWLLIIVGAATIAFGAYGIATKRFRCEDVLSAPITICTIDRRAR